MSARQASAKPPSNLCPIHGKKSRWLWGLWVCLPCDLSEQNDGSPVELRDDQ